MASESIPLKRCSKKDKCIHPEAQDGWLLATVEYFHRHKRMKSGLSNICKECGNAKSRLHSQEHQEERAAYNRRYYQEHAADQRAYSQRYRAEHPEQVAATQHRYYIEHHDGMLEYGRQYRQEHAEELRAYARRYHHEHIAQRAAYRQKYKSENSASLSAYHRRHYLKNAERKRSQVRIYRKDHPEVGHATRLRRRARKHDLLATFTRADWQRALGYFNGCCAVCGRQLSDLFGTHQAHADHWIPLSKGGETTAENIVPLCGGIGGCNNRKSDRDPLEFLATELGKRRATEILERIEAYFAWVITLPTA